MTSADLDHNDELLAAGKIKLEWVTPKISLMEAGAAEGNKDFPFFKESCAGTKASTVICAGPS
jgi:hypothetical protein